MNISNSLAEGRLASPTLHTGDLSPPREDFRVVFIPRAEEADIHDGTFGKLEIYFNDQLVDERVRSTYRAARVIAEMCKCKVEPEVE